MASRRKATASPGLNQYGFRQVKQSSKASALKTPNSSAASATTQPNSAKPKSAKPDAASKAGTQNVLKLKAPSKVTKSKAEPRSAKTNAKSQGEKRSSSKNQAAAKPKNASKRPYQFNTTPSTPCTPLATAAAKTAVVKATKMTLPCAAANVATERHGVLSTTPIKAVHRTLTNTMTEVDLPALPTAGRPYALPFDTASDIATQSFAGSALTSNIPSATGRPLGSSSSSQVEHRSTTSTVSESPTGTVVSDSFRSPLATNASLRTPTFATAHREQLKISLSIARTYASQARDAVPRAGSNNGQAEPSGDVSPLRSRSRAHLPVHWQSEVEAPRACARPSSGQAIVGNIILHSPPTDGNSATGPVLSLTLLPPRLVISASGYDEYVITTTCRLPSGSTCPDVSLTMSGNVPVSGSSGDSVFPGDSIPADEHHSDDEPLINGVAARAAARLVASARTSADVTQPVHRKRPSPLSVSKELEEIPVLHTPIRPKCSKVNTAACLEHLRAVESEERKLARRHMPRALTASHRRGHSLRQSIPARLGTQRRVTSRKTPIRTLPAIQEPSTVRRKKTWEKIERNMKDYHRRRYHFPHRQIFEQTIVENIKLARLEKFWRILSDLIAQRKIFSRQLWDHWEYLSVCVRLVNTRITASDKFGMAESDAAARELVRQRMVMYTGDGKIMLTKNALSTRLS